MITVTKPYLPDLEDYVQYIRNVWNRNILTNNGPLVRELENNLRKYLETDDLMVVSNGTVALQIAIKALGLNGEVITTPFSYVASTSSIVWESCKPVFVDIDKNSFNIDPLKIEEKITKNSSAILATHVFGYPCDIVSINKIAKKYNLKVIYDAAHAFGSRYNGKSIFEYGDISVASFHSTKIFHTVEGGAVFSHTKELLQKMGYMRNFGHAGPEKFRGVGINGKMSEFHAAMGLCVLPEMDSILKQRKDQYLFYLDELQGTDLLFQQIENQEDYNHSYFPVVFPSEEVLIRVKTKLEEANIHPRRYFYPILSKLSYVEHTESPIAESISRRILCLPIYSELSIEDLKLVSGMVKKY